MNNRLAIQDLAALLAEYTGRDKESCERFLHAFIAVVSEGVYTDRLVKVKGLGTFKIIPVEKRESIHVNTGERFVIPEHYKFSFLPDRELRELVNKPFSFFETTELGEGVDFTDMDVVPGEPETKETEDESVEEVIPEEQPLPEEQPRPQEAEAAEAIPAMERKRPRTMKRMAIAAVFVCLLLLFNIGLYLNRTHFFKKEKEKETLVSKEVIETPVLKVDTVFPEGVPVPTEAVPDTAAVPAGRDSSRVIARVKIEPGSRLTLIALEYYGSKLFWVYLYEFNSAVITDPNNVPIGTVIEVPAPELYGIDRRDRSSIEKAAARQTEILSGK